MVNKVFTWISVCSRLLSPLSKGNIFEVQLNTYFRIGSYFLACRRDSPSALDFVVAIPDIDGSMIRG